MVKSNLRKQLDLRTHEKARRAATRRGLIRSARYAMSITRRLLGSGRTPKGYRPTPGRPPKAHRPGNYYGLKLMRFAVEDRDTRVIWGPIFTGDTFPPAAQRLEAKFPFMQPGLMKSKAKFAGFMRDSYSQRGLAGGGIGAGGLGGEGA